MLRRHRRERCLRRRRRAGGPGNTAIPGPRLTAAGDGPRLRRCGRPVAGFSRMVLYHAFTSEHLTAMVAEMLSPLADSVRRVLKVG